MKISTRFLVIAAAVVAVASGLASATCHGTPNELPISTAAPTFVKSVPNGKLFRAGAADLDPQLYVIHVYGTPYEMGYAHGQLVKEEATAAFDQMLKYIYGEVDSYIKFLPPAVREIIEKDGVGLAMQATYELTKPYIPQHFMDEVRGLSAALNKSEQYVWGLQLFPELIQAACSMGGFWKGSVANVTSNPNALYQLRALDWGTDSPLQQWPAVVVYHPSNSTSAAKKTAEKTAEEVVGSAPFVPDQGVGHDFAIVSWAGFIGGITGCSSEKVCICEKVWVHYDGVRRRDGYPWHFLLRDILNFDKDIDAGLSRVASAHRTCSIYVGLGGPSDSGSLRFKALEYSYDTVNIFNSHNMASHTNFDDLVYIDKHTQPSGDTCMPSLIQEHYGNLNAETILRQITSQFQTGDMHIAVTNVDEGLMYISNASPYNKTTATAVPAYDRPFTRVNLTALFEEPAPAAVLALA